MRDQRASIIKIEQDVFAAAVDEVYFRCGKPLVKFTRTNARREKFAAKIGRFDRSIPQKRIETANDDLYFWKFRHQTFE